MPTIPIDFSNVESFDNLPLGRYGGNIDKIELRPTSDPAKFDQIQAAYVVTDDSEFLGRKQSEFLSLSPRAAFRLKKWFDTFGLAEGEISALEFDDDTNLLMEPDLVGIDVIFEVYEDSKLYLGEKQVRTRLVEVLEEAPAPAPTPARRAKAAPAPEPVAADDEGDEEEEEAEPAPAPRRALRKAAPVAAAPARRSLR